MTMTIDELCRVLKDAVDNGYGSCFVHVRKFGAPVAETKELEFFSLVQRDYGVCGRSAYGEIVFTEEEE